MEGNRRIVYQAGGEIFVLELDLDEHKKHQSQSQSQSNANANANADAAVTAKNNDDDTVARDVGAADAQSLASYVASVARLHVELPSTRLRTVPRDVEPDEYVGV